MRYYYVNEAGPVTGPVTGEELEELRRRGLVSLTTRIAGEGETCWRPLTAPAGAPATAPVSPPPLPVPLAARIIGVFNGLLGLGGILQMPFVLLGLMVLMAQAWSGVPPEDGVPLGWVVFQTVLGFLLSVLMVAGAAGLWTRQRWGLSLALTVAGVQVASAVAGFLVQTAGVASTVVPTVTAAVIPVTLMAGLVYPVIVLAFLGRRSVRRAFAD